MLNRKPSRSGNTQYGSNSNRGGDRPVQIDRAPIDLKRGSLGNQIRRSDDIRIGNVRIRTGYNHYDRRWRDDYFYYPHYVFDPYMADFVCSPWYYYPQLPPYFSARRCFVPTYYAWQPFYGVRYVYQSYNSYNNDYRNRDRNELDYVIEDITYAFTDGDRRSIDRLVPRRGNVSIIMDGRYAYSLQPDDFYDTLMDATQNTQTSEYKILDVQYRKDVASVYARHDFEDPWGRRTSVYHYFRLEPEGRDWVIREFGTSNTRW